MRGPKPTPITLTEVERQDLEQLAKRHTIRPSCARFACTHALSWLGGQNGLNNNAQVAPQEALSVDTARTSHWREPALARIVQPIALSDLPLEESAWPRCPTLGHKPPTITATRAGLQDRSGALACGEAPDERSGRPISQWSGREKFADEIDRGAIATQISGRHAGRLLKSGDLKAHLSSALLADPTN